MSKLEFETIMQVRDVLKGLQTMNDLLGETPKVQLSESAQRKWSSLEKKHDEFYKLDINDRLLFAEMGGKPKEAES